MSAELGDGGPAFPHGPLGDAMRGEDGREWHQYPAGVGMSLRDWFAGQAIVGAVTNICVEQVATTLNEASAQTGKSVKEILARSAYEVADAMLAARNGGAK